MAGLEEADGALFAALRQQGLEVASTVSTLGSLEAEDVFELCSRSVHAVNPNSRVPTTLTPYPSDRFRACTELANEIKSLGYKFEVGFQQVSSRFERLRRGWPRLPLSLCLDGSVADSLTPLPLQL